MKREPVLPITSRALAQVKHWLCQPSSAAEPELLCCDLPSWIATYEVQMLKDKPAIIIKLLSRSRVVSDSITLDASGFAVLRILTALGATCMVDQRATGGKR
jgi:hypothetical protein